MNILNYILSYIYTVFNSSENKSKKEKTDRELILERIRYLYKLVENSGKTLTEIVEELSNDQAFKVTSVVSVAEDMHYLLSLIASSGNTPRVEVNYLVNCMVFFKFRNDLVAPFIFIKRLEQLLMTKDIDIYYVPSVDSLLSCLEEHLYVE